MSHPEGEGAQSGAEGTQSGAGTATGSTGTDPNAAADGTQSGADGTQATTEVDRIAAQLEEQRKRTQAADKRAAETEAKLRQLVDKDLPAQEKLTRDLAEAQKTVENLQTTNGNLAIQVAFLKDNTYTWHNAETAMKLVDLSQVEIESDGSVKGMKDALKALAAANPYLIKTEASNEPVKPGSTAPGNNGGSTTTTPDIKRLAARFPTMNTRVRRG
jgi:hypothetical protein